ncbi:hypothetical protein DMB66_38340 [Actinoplanes sp. ATCC 53533]|uniref:hypothetical protein n=1 Tax=Actinoplanes sp. ATCC 53533 TaxID=1288362 RepID=UPI000F79C7E8|nr:hypothetical protein [Actinoplanes sp. ATCC 53533]RSM53873.1 hypothetical protein DMB66_38340 [Actinoplanes sp. ATCC 53533]
MPAAPTQPPPTFDAADAYPELRRLRAALAALDWAGARAIVDSAAEPAGRTLLIRAAGDREGLEPFLRSVLARDPDDAVAGSLLGGHLVQVGWKIRTSAQAQYVSAEQFRGFHEHLRRAEQVLIEAAARNPAEASIWCQRLISARGLQLGLSEVRRRYDRLAAYDPHHLPAQHQLLQSLCPKWSGTWEQMHTFAHECMLAAPKGAPNAVLVVTGHLERWLDDDSRGYLATPFARNEIYEAAARSVWDPNFRHGPGWVAVRNTFAMAFSVLGDHAAAAAQFAALGRFGTEDPWHYLGEPAAEFTKRRALAYAKGGAR